MQLNKKNMCNGLIKKYTSHACKICKVKRDENEERRWQVLTHTVGPNPVFQNSTYEDSLL